MKTTIGFTHCKSENKKIEMPWRDCHLGYLLLAYALWLLAYFFEFTMLFGVGFVAQLNGLYALVFPERSSSINRPLWYLAFIASVLVFALFTAMQFGLKWEGAKISWIDVLVITALTALASGQLRFLLRIRREQLSPSSDYQA